MFNLFSKKKQTSVELKINDEVLAVIYLLVEAANVDEVFEEKRKNYFIIKKQFHIENIGLIEERQLKRLIKAYKKMGI